MADSREEAAVVIGASGGIGAAMVRRLEASGRFAVVHALSRSDTGFDLEDEDSIAAAAARVGQGPALVARHFLPLLPRDRRAVFAALSARVGSIGDNRLGGWHSYRASKAALNMILRNLAIELARTHPQAVVAGLHPGTVDTGLSEPFQKGVKPEKLFTAESSAERLLAVMDALTPADCGRVFAWDGQPIPE